MKKLFGAVLVLAAMSPFAFSAFSGSQAAAGCDCCTDCISTRCVCDVAGCCDDGGVCISDCCATASCCETGKCEM